MSKPLAYAKELQAYHEQKLHAAVWAAGEEIKKELGEFPAPFAFFVMGSAGRKEQIYDSDQDHGIVFKGEDDRHLPYFLTFGERIVTQLEAAGYERCIGGVMASCERWCGSAEKWSQQLEHWLTKDTFEHVRYVLTFFDARTILGEHALVLGLKKQLFAQMERSPHLMKRFADNTGRMPQARNLFGQLLVEQRGEHQGALNVKEQILFPYVNGMRLLALQQRMMATSTLERFAALPPGSGFEEAERSFASLFERRAYWIKQFSSYKYIIPSQLTKEERNDLKTWAKEGRRLYETIQKIVEAGGSK